MDGNTLLIFILYIRGNFTRDNFFKKCLKKIELFQTERGIDVIELKAEINNVQKYFNNIDNANDINSSYIITLKVIHE